MFFFISGIFANLVSVFFYNSSLGASGAIFGIIGCLVILRPKMVVWAFSMPMPLFLAAILWVIGDFLGIFVPSNTANIAHLSGIALGFIFGIGYRRRFMEHKERRERIIFNESNVRDWEDRHIR